MKEEILFKVEYSDGITGARDSFNIMASNHGEAFDKARFHLRTYLGFNNFTINSVDNTKNKMENQKNKKEIQPILLNGQELLRQAGLKINGLIWMEEQFCENFSDPELINRFKKFTKGEIVKVKNQLLKDLTNLK